MHTVLQNCPTGKGHIFINLIKRHPFAPLLSPLQVTKKLSGHMDQFNCTPVAMMRTIDKEIKLTELRDHSTQANYTN
jgi:hypothetical protein